MDIETLYWKVKETVDRLDFTRIWPGFKPLKFALYDSEKCFFDGRYIEKTGEFCANTSIRYTGEQIAIWMVNGETDIPVLASKLVHEMFHGWQTLKEWNCWPDEMEALFRYRYSTENLCLKLRENELLLKLLDRFDRADYNELTALKKLRSETYPYEFSYESRVEEIEGSAVFVEWQVLKQLDGKAATVLTDRMRETFAKPGSLFPIRIPCYDTGALMIHAMLGAGTDPFASGERPKIVEVLKEIAPSDGNFAGKDGYLKKVSEAAAAYEKKTESIVRSALEKNEIVLEGPKKLVFVNIYNARHWNEYLTSTFFLKYRDGEEDRTMQGDFVIRMRDRETIDTVYRWETAHSR